MCLFCPLPSQSHGQSYWASYLGSTTVASCLQALESACSWTAGSVRPGPLCPLDRPSTSHPVNPFPRAPAPQGRPSVSFLPLSCMLSLVLWATKAVTCDCSIYDMALQWHVTKSSLPLASALPERPGCFLVQRGISSASYIQEARY